MWVGVKHRCHNFINHDLLLKLAYFQFPGGQCYYASNLTHDLTSSKCVCASNMSDFISFYFEHMQ